MTSDDRKSVPKPVAGFDVSQLPISPIEGFLLSRIDGHATLAELGTLVGLSVDDARKTVVKLAEYGAVSFLGVEAKVASKEASHASSSVQKVAAIASPTPSVAYDPALLQEAVDLEPTERKRVLDLFFSLEELDHYELLGVPRDADRKAIKSAYYGFVSTLHTDRYFGKNLGSFKQKMEVVFGRMTLAHDTLSAKPRRAEYDEYLVERDRTKAYEKLFAWAESPKETRSNDPSSDNIPAAPPLTSASGMMAAVNPDAVAPPPPSSSTMQAARPASQSQTFRAVTPPIAPSASQTMRAVIPPTPTSASQTMRAVTPPSESRQPAAPSTAPAAISPEERARRDALARRLMGGRQPTGARSAAGGSASPPIASRTALDPRMATESIKQRYQDGVDAARKVQAKRLIEAGDQALARDDVAVAANNFRLALNYTEDPEVRAKYESINQRAREIMTAAYLKQAAYEESQDKWTEAALSYSKAVDARPDDATVAERAANALRRAGRDLHRAARFAESAVQKNPNNPEFRVTLGHVYFDAGLYLRARSELEHAARLAPDDARTRELLVRLKKVVG